MDAAQTKFPAILIVDDSPSNLRLLLDALKSAAWKTFVATNGEGALRQAEFARPDLILLDVMMPGLNGFETCRRLKQNPATQAIPVIFMTALSETVDKLKGFDAGGVDYLTKPFDCVELLARVRVHWELKRAREQLERANQDLRAANQQLLAYQEQLERTARTDPLTQLANRREMLERIAEEQSRAARSAEPFVLAIGDIDDFKRINDTFGHLCGDAVLVVIAKLMRAAIRKQDQVARWGGEEFLLLFSATDGEGARRILERLRETLATAPHHYRAQRLAVTMTFGGSVFDDPAGTLDDCLRGCFKSSIVRTVFEDASMTGCFGKASLISRNSGQIGFREIENAFPKQQQNCPN